jgi:hypothetical protein
VTWGSVALGVTNPQLNDIAFGPTGGDGVFVAVMPTLNNSNTRKFLFSTDGGDTFSSGDMPDLTSEGIANGWGRVKWNPSAAGAGGGLGDGCFSACNFHAAPYFVATSPTGLDGSWTLMGRVDSGASSLARGTVAFSPTLGASGRWVAIGRNSSGQPQARYSDNGGTTWSASSGLVGPNWTDIIWSSRLGLFVCTSIEGTTGYSANGVTFTTAATIDSGNRLIELPTFILCTQNSNVDEVYTSTDGQSWTTHTIGTVSTGYQYAVYNGTKIVMSAYGADSNFKNTVAADPSDVDDWDEYIDNQLSQNITGLASRWTL